MVCLRIGYCQRGENLPGPQMSMGSWGQSMWLSNRDFCHGAERAVIAEGVGHVVLNLMSDNPGMRWDIETTRRVIGYAPQDGARPVLTGEIIENEATLHAARTLLASLDGLVSERRW